MSKLMQDARSLWINLAGVPVTFTAGRTTVVVSPDSRLSPPDWVGLVRLGDAVLTTVPGEAEAEAVRDAAASLAPEELVDPDRVRELLPVRQVLGPARLDYLESGSFVAAHERAGVDAVPGDHPDLVDLLARAGEEDASESGLGDLSSPAFVLRRSGRAIAAAGYRRWPSSVAHLGVLVDPDWRGRALAVPVSSAATAHALAAGLLPQWRARVVPSQHTAARLGFRALGNQLSFRLDGVG